MQLVIGNHNYSSWSMRPWLFVDYHSLPIEVLQMDLLSEGLLEKLGQHFSNGKVPLLIDGETDVWDSLAILETLGERFPETNPWPVDPAARAVARSVSAEMHSSFMALRSELPMNCRKFYPGYVLSEDAVRDIDRIVAIWSWCRSRFAKTGPWLFGEFSIADAMYAPVVMRFRSADIALTAEAGSYCATMNACPSVAKWISLALAEQSVLSVDELERPSELLTQ